MRIEKISVNGLFGIFNHLIPLNKEERITIIHGPNGFGKTAILRILDGLFNARYSAFRTIPFNTFRVEFDNGSRVEIVKTSDTSKKTKEKNQIIINLDQPNSKKKTFHLEEINDPDETGISLDILDHIIPGLDRIGSKAWRYVPTGETLSVNEIIDRFSDFLPANINLNKKTEWLEKLREDVHIRLIESQRLLNFSFRRSPRLSYRPSGMSPTVSNYSKELAENIESKQAEYGRISQSLDRTFPVRLVTQKPSPDLTEEKLREQLYQLEETRSRLIETGLLDKDENSDFQIPSQAIDDNTKNILSIYVQDVEKKLSVFSEIGKKIELLREIINNKFAYSYKKITFNKEKGFVFQTTYKPSSSDPETLSPEDLSSGEQHELVLLYELLFKVQPNSLVLIDEPELSLHVGWQVQFLKDLQEITRLVDIDILMATHSPSIIKDRWDDLTVELKGPER